MASIGYGYGSEFHLLRYMGRYRNEFNRLIAAAIQDTVECWLDFDHGGAYAVPPPPSGPSIPDKELTGLEFLDSPNFQSVLDDWKTFWPTTGNQPNWDAVGRVKVKCNSQWLLVEAKAHVGELISSCKAKDPMSIKKIDDAFSTTQHGLNITPGGDWKSQYYQLANRLAVLCFLRSHNIPARLLLIYFLGDKNPAQTSNCPQSVADWRPELDKQDLHIGLDPARKKELGIHELFIEGAP